GDAHQCAEQDGAKDAPEVPEESFPYGDEGVWPIEPKAVRCEAHNHLQRRRECAALGKYRQREQGPRGKDRGRADEADPHLAMFLPTSQRYRSHDAVSVGLAVILSPLPNSRSDAWSLEVLNTLLCMISG